MLARLPFTLLIALIPLAYLLACAITAGLLAPFLPAPLRGLINFDTLVHRGGEVILILGLFPLAKRLPLGAPDIGLPGSRHVLWRQVRRAFLWGCLMMGVHFVLIMGIEARRIDPQKLELLRLARLAFKGLLIGIVVASIEEPLFRGVLFGGLVSRIGRLGAVLVSSFYFAALHFLDSDLRPTWENVGWDSGLRMIIDAFSHIPLAAPDGFLALFAAGSLLACIRIWRPLGLGYCMGLHMGWVFVIKTFKPFTYNGTALIPGLTSRYDGIIGYLSAAWTAALIVLVLAMAFRAKTAQEAS
ncbi:type II CAAX endopeptidase family protein [Methylococcus sp. EFPC2]|uniref:type II CAAX endopeptidase family protein n=1 Tax=Methylococcus sp. EFPC2 TaxID=2812648 RepID=UPI0019683D9A|nr:CPBP family intramembrane glutamic endopeptidase [Methylococcus sp. EFPC2]QSA95524.1 CPBP family intramembrane metalloprotease [Methylococcus sp. EFPC2]